LLSLSFAIKTVTALAFLGAVLSFYPAVFEKVGTVTFTTLTRLLNH